MIVAADDPQSGITPSEIHGNVLTMLLAGEDTTANTLAWAIWLLSKHPDCFARARAEVDAQAGDPAEWSIERFGELDYRRGVRQRDLAAAPGRAVPDAAGAARDERRRHPHSRRHADLGALRSDSLREEHFDEPDRFKPERWLAEGGHSASSASRVAMPFGAGPRVCPGRHLAMLEIKMALAVLLGRFDIENVAPARSDGPADEPAEGWRSRCRPSR